MKRNVYWIILWCSTLFACQSNQPGKDEAAIPQPELAPKIVDSLDYMIGQMLMVGFRGTQPDSIGEIGSMIENGNLGGVILYEYDVPLKSRPRNITSAEQIKDLCSYLQDLRPEPLLIGIDEEGGKVTRLKERYGFQTIPSAQYLGELDLLDSTRHYAQLNGQKLKSVGVNVNFAPVVDLNVNPQSPAIGAIERSFSAETGPVGRHMTAYLEGQQSAGVVGCIKHFPGHGSATTDSHEGFTDVSATWSALELQPYVDFIEQALPGMIMTAHVYNKILDPTYPATLSAPTIQGLLRSKHRYNGVIISDDLMMGAVSEQFGFEEGIQLALAAGVDILLFSNNIPGQYDPKIASKVHQLIGQWVDEGTIQRARIEQSFERIQAVKKAYL
ncbi:MAG: glycoside hydrolase family 3 protein [Bacteroidota bacterium]